MTLRSKLASHIALLIGGMLLISAAGLWGLKAQGEDLGAALHGYEELRELYEIGSHVAAAKTLVGLDAPYHERAAEELATADGKFTLFRMNRKTHDAAMESAVKESLRDAMAEVSSGGARQPGVDAALARLANLAADIRHTIASKQEAAEHKQQTALAAVGILSAFVVLGAVILGLSQYRAVMSPLGELGRSVRRIAAGELSDRVAVGGHAEFTALAGDFNRMTERLDELYRQLEEKVAAKSKQLVRSERLAGVGYLAAGVAHEINNPLSIITGYAEFWLNDLRAHPEKLDSGEAEKNLRIICEEAFRCKQIIEKLLSLASGGDEKRTAVRLADVAKEVTGTVGGLQKYADRPIEFQVDSPDQTIIIASEGEMKQVILNLVINALEAVAGGGKVNVSVGRRDGKVELNVSDTGMGMSPATLGRVFEPFFSSARDGGERNGEKGVGLGLSITHAIVENHGGSIDAFSEGIGRGSRFVVQLPPAGEMKLG